MTRSALRTALVFACCALVLAAGVLLAWVSHQPNHPRLVAAERWPMVGPVVMSLRQAYQPPETVRVGGPRSRSPEGPQADAAALGLPPWEGTPGYVWVQDGMVLRIEPSNDAPEVLRFDSISNLARLERRGDWFRVWRRGVEGWVHMPGYEEEPEEPPWGEEPEAPGPLAPLPPSPEHLERALSLMDGDPRETRFGPYRAYVDFDDPNSSRYCRRWRHRPSRCGAGATGWSPWASRNPSVILYQSPVSYRLLERASDQLRGLDAEGFAGFGLVATYVGGKNAQAVAATLVHEICHRIHRRALGPALPPWLEEGLADDLALSRLDGGRLDPTGYSGRRITSEASGGVELRFTQGLAALWNLKEEILRGQMPLLTRLTDLDRAAFLDPSAGMGQRRLRYDAMALWVRYLVSADDGRHRQGWQRFLRGIANGGPVTSDALLDSLAVPADELEADFRTWVVRQSREFVGQ